MNNVIQIDCITTSPTTLMTISAKKLLNYVGIPVLALILIITFYSNLFQRWEGVSIYIPEGYSGPVAIYYGQEGGERIDQVFSQNVIRVPENGVFSAREGKYFITAPKKFFFAQDSSMMTETTETEVSCLQEGYLPGPDSIPYTSFIVGESNCEVLPAFVQNNL